MTENSINPISNVSMSAAGSAMSAQQAKKATVDTSTTSTAGNVQAEAARQATAAAASTPVSKPATSAGSISVSFRIDDDTNELTVYVVDRENKKVLRTIPSSEFSKLSAGDILQLTV